MRHADVVQHVLVQLPRSHSYCASRFRGGLQRPVLAREAALVSIQGRVRRRNKHAQRTVGLEKEGSSKRLEGMGRDDHSEV